jgi:hypothetical protein
LEKSAPWKSYEPKTFASLKAAIGKPEPTSKKRKQEHYFGILHKKESQKLWKPSALKQKKMFLLLGPGNNYLCTYDLYSPVQVALAYRLDAISQG